MIKFLASCYLGIFIIIIALTIYQRLWFELALMYFVVWNESIFKDITKRKNVEASIKKSYEKKDEI